MSVYEAKIIQIASIPSTKVAKIQVYAKSSQGLESHTVSSSVIFDTDHRQAMLIPGMHLQKRGKLLIFVGCKGKTRKYGNQRDKIPHRRAVV